MKKLVFAALRNFFDDGFELELCPLTQRFPFFLIRVLNEPISTFYKLEKKKKKIPSVSHGKNFLKLEEKIKIFGPRDFFQSKYFAGTDMELKAKKHLLTCNWSVSQTIQIQLVENKGGFDMIG